MGLNLAAPDHTPLRRVPTHDRLHLIVDSTGLSIVGEGVWATVKHAGRGIRGWRKLHLGVDGGAVRSWPRR